MMMVMMVDKAGHIGGGGGRGGAMVGVPTRYGKVNKNKNKKNSIA